MKTKLNKTKFIKKTKKNEKKITSKKQFKK